MLLVTVGILIGASIYLVLYQFKLAKPESGQAHLPVQIMEEDLQLNLAVRRDPAFGAGLKHHYYPLSEKYKELEQRIAAQSLRRRLKRAGSPVGVLEFFAFKILSLISLPALTLLFFGSFSPRKDILLIVALAAGYFLPENWLNKKINKRQHNIRKDLPSIIDLLNLCVSGGLDFMLAINRVVKDLRPCELTEELAEVYRETQMGKSRREALKNFAERVDIPEAHSFVRTLVQADRMGAPMAEILKLQAEEIRSRRFQRGEAMALKAPIKLLFPLFAFILPVVLILVAGPIFIQFTKSNIGF